MIGNHNQKRNKERNKTCRRRGKRNQVKLAFKRRVFRMLGGGVGGGKKRKGGAESVLRIFAKRVNKYKKEVL
jgi:hypothetical protein